MKCGHCGCRDVDLDHVRGHGLAGPVQVARPGPATEGMYRKGGQIYRVRRGPSGHLWAALANVVQDSSGRTVVSYSKANGMVAKLSQADRMAMDEVAAFGQLTSTCLICGTELENAESVKRGIGPICASRI